MRGPAARNAVDPVIFVEFIDSVSYYLSDGFPRRRRRYIHGVQVSRDHARMLARWWKGEVKGLTPRAAQNFLKPYGLTTDDLVAWSITNNKTTMLRGVIA